MQTDRGVGTSVCVPLLTYIQQVSWTGIETLVTGIRLHAQLYVLHHVTARTVTAWLRLLLLRAEVAA